MCPWLVLWQVPVNFWCSVSFEFLICFKGVMVNQRCDYDSKSVIQGLLPSSYVNRIHCVGTSNLSRGERPFILHETKSATRQGQRSRQRSFTHLRLGVCLFTHPAHFFLLVDSFHPKRLAWRSLWASWCQLMFVMLFEDEKDYINAKCKFVFLVSISDI